MADQKLEHLHKEMEMEVVRKRMQVSVEKWGINDQRTIKISQELDLLIYEVLVK